MSKETNTNMISLDKEIYDELMTNKLELESLLKHKSKAIKYLYVLRDKKDGYTHGGYRRYIEVASNLDLEGIKNKTRTVLAEKLQHVVESKNEFKSEADGLRKEVKVLSEKLDAIAKNTTVHWFKKILNCLARK